jgi:cysteine desulfuration protein SufE
VFLADRLKRTIDDFSVFEDPQERLAALVDRARKIPPLPSEERVEANRVRGCVSVVWIQGEIREGDCYFRGDAESPLVRGLVVFLCDFFSGVPMAEVAGSDLEPLEALGLTHNLSPTRRAALAAARQSIRIDARRAQGSRENESRPLP